MFALFELLHKTNIFVLFLLTSLLTLPSIAAGQTKTGSNAQANVQDATLIHRQYKPVVGQPHLDFILPSIDGDKNIQLSDYRGKKVLLLHFASW